MSQDTELLKAILKQLEQLNKNIAVLTQVCAATQSDVSDIETNTSRLAANID